MVSFTRFISVALVAASAIAAPVGVVSLDGGPSKRGAAYNDVSLIQSLLSGKPISWAYNWNVEANGDVPKGVMYIPMLWGTKMLGQWPDAAEKALSSGSKYIFGFNEPDIPSQSVLSVQDAANLFRQHITPYGNRATLATPAVTNSQSPNEGLDYLSQFLDACSDCGAKIAAVHWYGDSVDDFKKHVNDAVDLAHKKGLDEVWITEFALNDPTKAVSFLSQALPFLDTHEGVGGYAYFYCANGYLLENGKALSESGKLYTS